MNNPLEDIKAEYKFDDGSKFVMVPNTEFDNSIEERLEKLEAFMEKALANPMIAGMLE